jgi:uncharacterized membrane protein HdeD (DUF308 family)
MIERVASHWWLFLIRGLLALAIGVAAPFFPIATLYAITILFGAYAFIDGAFALVTAFRVRHENHRWIWLIVEGVIGIGVGLYVFAVPAAGLFALVLLLGFWAVFTGAFEVASAFNMRVHVPNEWLWIIIGALSIVFGVFVFFAPIFGLFALLWMFSIYFVVTGIALIALAFRLRSLVAHKMHPAA